MVLVKMLMKIGPSTMRGLLVMTMALISPFRREVSLVESLRWRAKVLVPKFRLEMMVFPKVFSLFFQAKTRLFTRRWATKAG